MCAESRNPPKRVSFWTVSEIQKTNKKPRTNKETEKKEENLLERFIFVKLYYFSSDIRAVKKKKKIC